MHASRSLRSAPPPAPLHAGAAPSTTDIEATTDTDIDSDADTDTDGGTRGGSLAALGGSLGAVRSRA